MPETVSLLYQEFKSYCKRLPRETWRAGLRLFRYGTGRCGIDRAEFERYREQAKVSKATLIEADFPALLVEKLRAGVALVAHEDSLNWSKLYNYLYLNIGLLGTLGLILGRQERLSPLDQKVTFMVTLIGIVAALGFTLTLWSGICCLVGHKEVVKSVDLALAGIEDQYMGRKPGTEEAPSEDMCALGWCNDLPNSIFYGKVGPSRTVLRCAPLVGLGLWILIAVWVRSEPLKGMSGERMGAMTQGSDVPALATPLAATAETPPADGDDVDGADAEAVDPPPEDAGAQDPSADQPERNTPDDD